MVARLLFLLYHHIHWKNVAPFDFILVFLHGGRMDASMAAYICIIPFLFSIGNGSNWFSILVKWYTIFVLFLSSIIVIADLETFKAWKYRLEASALDYLNNQKEALASVESAPIIFLLFLFTLIFCIFIFLKPAAKPFTTLLAVPVRATLAILVTATLVLPMRGGWGIAPLNPGAVFFSKNHFINLGALNASWNFLHSWVNKKVEKNPFINFTPQRRLGKWFLK